MDSEKTFKEQHETPERFPSKEEIRSVFETIINGRQYTELPGREKSDEQGVYLYEIEVPFENGEKVECNYQRANYNYKELQGHPGGNYSASIHLYQYDADGMPVGGKRAANYLNGVWKFYPEEIKDIF